MKINISVLEKSVRLRPALQPEAWFGSGLQRQSHVSGPRGAGIDAGTTVKHGARHLWFSLLVALSILVGQWAFAAPSVLIQPQIQVVAAGATVTVTAEATGEAPLTYQWQFFAVGTPPADLDGETGPTLAVENAQGGSWVCRVIVTDVNDEVATAAARVTVLDPPTIRIEMFELTLAAGEEITLRPELVAGSPPFRYQWQFAEANLEGETRAELALVDLRAEQEGEYSLVVTNAVGATTNTIARIHLGQPAFTLVRDDPVVDAHTDSSPAKWGDYDGDGYQDLYVRGAGLYHNNGDGSFSRAAVPGFPSVSTVATWVDYDNDGDLDITAQVNDRVQIYRQSTAGNFQAVSVYPITTDFGDRRGFGWADFDNDGDLDFFRSNTYYESDFLYRNAGDGTFSRLKDSPVEHDQSRAYGCKWVDYDHDGAMDLYTADIGSFGGFLYSNCGNGRFIPFTFADAGLLNHGLSIDSAWGDCDNDGDLDVLIGNRGYGNHFSPNAFFRNEGDGTFTKLTDTLLTRSRGAAWGAGWADYDNDGHLDLFVPNGKHWGSTEHWNNFLYHNNGDGTFTRVMDSRVNHDSGESWGTSWADYDNDGFLDLFVANYKGQHDFLYHNEGNDNAWLMLRLIGTASNRSAIGAWVQATAVIDGEEVIQTRHVVDGFAYGQPDSRVHFGLGDATKVDRLRIEWPSGTVQELSNVDVRQILEITEVIPTEISISQQPESLTVSEGSTAKLFARVGGPQPLTYQWQHDGEDLQGATNRILYLPEVSPEQGGGYRLVISVEGLAPTITEAASLIVTPPTRPAPHEFVDASVRPNGTVEATMAGEAPPGFFDVFAVDASDDLENWQALPPVVSDAGVATVVDPGAPNRPRRFFRTLQDGFWTPYPAPTGSHAVGTFRRQIEDASSRKRLMVTVWYPAQRDLSRAPATWYESAYVDYLAERFGPGMKVLNHVHGHSTPMQALAEEQTTWPALVLSHAYKGHREDNRDLAEALASHGYIVVAANHRDAEFTQMDDGTIVQGIGDLWYQQFEVVNYRLTEERILYDQLAIWNDSDPLLAGRINLEAMGALGFSVGGESAVQLARSDSRCRAAAVIGLEPFWTYHLDSAGVVKPILIALEEPVGDVTSSDFYTNNPGYRLFGMARGPAYYLRIGGTMHHSLTGVMRVVAPHVPGGETDNRRAAEILNELVVSFFNKHLLEHDDHLLDDANTAIPELAVYLNK